MITDTQLKEWRKLTKAATKGKWEPASKGSRIIHIHGAVSVEGVIECDDGKDAAFVATARTAVPALLDEVEGLKAREEFMIDAAKKAEREQERLRQFLSDGEYATIQSEQAWKRRAERAEADNNRIRALHRIND